MTQTRIPCMWRRGLARVAVAMFALAVPLLAQSPDELAKQADQQLRSAERSMFAGKLEEAQQQFAQVKDLVARLEKDAPAHKGLKTLQSKRDKLQRDLERRTAKTPPPAPATGGNEPAAATLPAGVSKRLRDFDEKLQRLSQYLEGDSAASPDGRKKTALGFVEQARGVLAEIDKMYGKDVPADHAALVAARARLTAAEADIEAFHRRLVQAAAAPKPEDPASADRKKVEELYERFAAPMDAIHGNSLVYGLTVADAQKALDQVAAIERDVLPTLQPALAALATKYGTDSMQIDGKLHEMGVPPPERFATELERLIEGVAKVSRSRLASAAYLADNVAMLNSAVDGMVPDARVKRLQEGKARLLIAQQLDPNNQKVNSQLAEIDARIEATAAKIEADIDSAAWAGHVADFPGPGKVEELAAAAMDYFRKDDRWGANDKLQVEVLKVAVRGPWRVAQRDIFGRVTSWRLPIHLAITNPSLRERGVARVYELSAVAQEGAPDKAPQAPPFDGYWVGNNWMLRLEKL